MNQDHPLKISDFTKYFTLIIFFILIDTILTIEILKLSSNLLYNSFSLGIYRIAYDIHIPNFKGYLVIKSFIIFGILVKITYEDQKPEG